MTVTTGAADAGGYVLAGGGSTRFGRDKAVVEVGDEVLLARLCSMLRSISSNVRIIGSPEKYGGLGVPCISDRWPGEGPLGGIITALDASANSTHKLQWNLIIGCDMPFLTCDWLAYLIDRARASEAEVVVPKSARGLEPLCACWRTTARAKLQRAFEGGIRKVTEGMKHLSTEVLDEADWKRFDSANRLFWNMNTPADYDEAKRILEAERE